MPRMDYPAHIWNGLQFAMVAWLHSFLPPE